MNPQHPQHPAPEPEHFDRAMRNRYAEALDQVSPATLARLRAARREATRAQVQRGRGWKLAGACAALVALALATQLQLPRTAPSPPALAVHPAPERVDAAVAALDENPDLYLWLAANDDALPPSSEYRP